MTGAASGSGQATAELLALEGGSMMVTDLDESRGLEVVAGIVKQDHKAILLQPASRSGQMSSPRLIGDTEG